MAIGEADLIAAGIHSGCAFSEVQPHQRHEDMPLMSKIGNCNHLPGTHLCQFRLQEHLVAKQPKSLIRVPLYLALRFLDSSMKDLLSCR
ncbi:hypothetical protein O6P43_007729 [Quillaja saponaria]|uniref:Uncharacterized protein n=1 Tax=Quillaja saponaria TaxID=32244 RepID=A0AAD7QB43_QUISA|nr:hypothetical protein O6P43_007729 [Quillaja saponaria]